MASELLLTSPDDSSEVFKSLASIARRVNAVRYFFLFMGMTFLLWEMFFVVLGLGEGLTFWVMVEITLVTLLYPPLVWFSGNRIERLATQAVRHHADLLDMDQRLQQEVAECWRLEEALRQDQRQIRDLVDLSVQAYDGEQQRAASPVDNLIAQPLVAVYYQVKALEETMT